MPPKKVDWAVIRRKLPMEQTPEAKAKRAELFKQFDPNGNRYLSLAEIDKGFRDVLGLYEVFDCKPVLMRAFQAAKCLNNKKAKQSARGPDYVEFAEFRMLLWYVRQYFEIWQMFDEVDTSDDRRVEFKEFQAALPKIAEWGVKVTDPQAEFKAIDKNGGGVILFDEFADWALTKGLDLVDDDE